MASLGFIKKEDGYSVSVAGNVTRSTQKILRNYIERLHLNVVSTSIKEFGYTPSYNKK